MVNITVRYGFRSRHPILRIALGVILLTPFPFAVNHVLGYLWYDNGLMVSEVLLVVPAIYGVQFMLMAGRRGYFLDVRTDVGRRQIPLGPAMSAQAAAEVAAWLRGAGYAVFNDFTRKTLERR